ncbi:MAG TPA: hypothetical protein VGA21_04525 [Cyclobacteriaceae bacterium]|jgi:hypothetical protein
MNEAGYAWDFHPRKNLKPFPNLYTYFQVMFFYEFNSHLYLTSFWDIFGFQELEE